MRATINFEVDVDQVEETMAVLIAQEAHTLRAAADIIDVQPGPRTMVLEEVTEALRLLQETSGQLRQYRDMILNFQREKLGSKNPVIPEEDPVQPHVPPGNVLESLEKLKAAVGNVSRFDNFLEKINVPAVEEEDPDEDTEG
jgi:hypothetical protein